MRWFFQQAVFLGLSRVPTCVHTPMGAGQRNLLIQNAKQLGDSGVVYVTSIPAIDVLLAFANTLNLRTLSTIPGAWRLINVSNFPNIWIVTIFSLLVTVVSLNTKSLFMMQISLTNQQACLLLVKMYLICPTMNKLMAKLYTNLLSLENLVMQRIRISASGCQRRNMTNFAGTSVAR